MMKYILVFLILSRTAFCLEWSDFIPSENQISGVILLILFAEAGAQDSNCTSYSYPQYTLTDSETIGYAWWQVGSGIWATGMIVSNFFAPWLFARKAMARKAAAIQENIDSLQNDIARMIKNKRIAEEVFNMMDKIVPEENL